MQNIKVYPAGFELTHSVPETTDEYNALAPKRENAVLVDAVSNVEYRGVFPIFRAKLVEALEKDTGVTLINSGTEEDPVYESEGKYLKRVIAASGLTKEAFVAKYTPIAQSILDGIKFDPSVKERTGDGPAIGKRDIANAQELLKRGDTKVAEVAAALATKLGRPVETDEKNLARALADFRRLKAAEQEAKNAAEIGL